MAHGQGETIAQGRLRHVKKKAKPRRKVSVLIPASTWWQWCVQRSAMLRVPFGVPRWRIRHTFHPPPADRHNLQLSSVPGLPAAPCHGSAERCAAPNSVAGHSQRAEPEGCERRLHHHGSTRTSESGMYSRGQLVAIREAPTKQAGQEQK